MNYLYEAIKPTRLYIKQCPHCGLKYFGKSTREDVENYRGSGTRWNRHLNYHGAEPVHLWNSDWYNDTSISRFALRFSSLNKIVSSEIWANLKEENGLDGGWDHLNDGSGNHIERTRKGRISADKVIMEMYGVNNISQTTEMREMQSNRTKQMWADGLFDHVDHGAAFRGNTHTDETKRCIGYKNSIRQSGSGNSQYGTMWIHSVQEKLSRKINKNEPIPEGWFKGRKMKFQ